MFLPDHIRENSRRIVVKIGSSLLVDEAKGSIKQKWLCHLGEDIQWLIEQNRQVLVVSSGAIALGRGRLGLDKVRLSLPKKQAAAAAGQAVLIQSYENALMPHGITTAQALLSLSDTENRRGWLNARATLETLLGLGAVPVINENDTVATEEIRYGDNDRLAARVAQMCSADLLVLLSDIDGLYDKDPHQHKDARFIARVDKLTPDIMAMGGEANSLRGTGSGGMATKLQAARIATSAGCALAITKGERDNPLRKLLQGQTRATWFAPQTDVLTARKRWIAGQIKPSGSLHIDAGAVTALQNGKSLLAVGVTCVDGAFSKGDTVRILGPDKSEIGLGLVAYDADSARLIKGVNSADIEKHLGYNGEAILIHRDNMVIHS